jgi:hypothetical protein
LYCDLEEGKLLTSSEMLMFMVLLAENLRPNMLLGNTKKNLEIINSSICKSNPLNLMENSL